MPRSLNDTADRLINSAIELTRAQRYGEAGALLLNALEDLEATQPRIAASEQLRALSDICLRAGHPDLALMTLRQLLDISDGVLTPSQRTADLLTLSSCWASLARPVTSTTVNESALAFAVEHALWADAASASTNLAALAASSGHLTMALERLQTSLGYLEKDNGNPSTDAITRLLLLRVTDALGSDPEPALLASTELFDRLEPEVGRDRWEDAAPAFHRLVERHLAAHPEINADAWKRETFPRVFGEVP